MDNTIIIVLLIAVVIYLIFQSTPQKEDFGWYQKWKNDACHPSSMTWLKMLAGCKMR